jgi:hypothetical protein
MQPNYTISIPHLKQLLYRLIPYNSAFSFPNAIQSAALFAIAAVPSHQLPKDKWKYNTIKIVNANQFPINKLIVSSNNAKLQLTADLTTSTLTYTNINKLMSCAQPTKSNRCS